MRYLKYWFWNIIAVTIMGLMPVVIHAESIKLVQWWGEYLPHHGKKHSGHYQGKRSIQYQDVNGDDIYNDALIWYGFGLNEFLSPPSETDTGKKYHQYRVDYPSARFYGGVVARFTNVSHITEKDKKGNKIPFFDHIQQATVQPTEGGRPCSYITSYPHNSGRTWTDNAGKEWADMTVMVVNDGGECCPISDKFQKTKDAEVNFTSVFLWKRKILLMVGQRLTKSHLMIPADFPLM
ncbi:secreted protein [Beggiatoa sp. PS]|nr:secreted protein [Beggiatoa sp. PS]